MAAIKNFFAGIGVYAVPVLSIMAMVLVFYIPRFTEFWNYLRLAPRSEEHTSELQSL